ncbi:hypothetical protein L6164_007422 [Bauhinia variegata]|uniref:Uncharacterized protein n=1 Tax=Bauhinia variegata TaxID=167791 RepID=A0ACB9PDM5_BAUVA|nr:hypothetical protein L6164_007422 [Bauhinia variegata]
MDHTLQLVLAGTASFFVVILIFAAIILACRRNMKIHRTRPATNPDISSITVDASWSSDPQLQISKTELAASTNNFSPDLVIDYDSFGIVYKASLSNGTTVAIKKLSPHAFQGFREFREETETIGELRHQNIVKILGYYASSGSETERLIVYEFPERGSLDQWLHDLSSPMNDVVQDVRLPLSWETRIKIIHGVANGLCYLHQLDEPIIHGDIRASSVLLGSNFEAHIAGFGQARSFELPHTQVSTQLGYTSPEYRDGLNWANVKVDVYSFGVLMLATATGYRPNRPLKWNNNKVGLVEWAGKMTAQNDEMRMIDSAIPKDELSEDSVKAYFETAGLCTSELQKDRPEMAEVLKMLGAMPMIS